MSKINAIASILIVAMPILLSGSPRASAKDGRQVLETLRVECESDLKRAGLDRPAAMKLYGTPIVRSIRINLYPVRRLVAGETVDVVVEGEFPAGTKFAFTGWSSYSEMASLDGFDIIKEELDGGTLHAKIKLPKEGLVDERRRPDGNRAYVNLVVNALSKSCSPHKKALELGEIAPIGEPTAQGRSARPDDSTPRHHHGNH